MQFRNRQSDIPIALYRTFVVISELGSFTKAAEELKLTQSAISVQMKRLQKLVGGGLFVKQAVGIGLSDLGLWVEEYARRILILNDQVMAVAGRASHEETVYLGIQNVFARKMLPDVLNACSGDENKSSQIICGSAPYLTEKLRAGYVDLAVMLPLSELRLNALAEWTEKMVWVRAAHLQPLDGSHPVPIVHREAGLIDRKVMKLLDQQGVPYRVAFGATDMGTLVAAVEAGMGVLVVPERVALELPDTVVIAEDRILPRIPEIRGGVFYKEGFDLKRHRPMVDAFLSVVRPPHVKPTLATRAAARSQASERPLRRTGTNIHRS
ncbi:MAG: LysR family transcriptional regulator [Xanthobacteraceae bacterium]|jgi:DNA-binding transcriptional LysR family regulator